jgi:hypothetical protein
MQQGYHYQSGTQLGTPAQKESHLLDLLKHPGTIAPATYCGEACKGTSFDAAATKDVDAWVRGSGSRLMFLYGADDPWTAGAFELGQASDSFRYTVKGGTHSASIADLPAAERAAATATLRRWAKLPAAGTAGASEAATDDRGDGSLAAPEARGLEPPAARALLARRWQRRL